MDQQKKVLIVEDDSFLSSLAAERLTKEGYMVTVAGDGAQALEKLKHEVPDLMLLDIIMPEMNGFEVLKRVKGDPKLKDMAILVFSNVEQEDEIAEAKALGADDFMVKAHFTIKEVGERINEILQRRGKL